MKKGPSSSVEPTKVSGAIQNKTRGIAFRQIARENRYVATHKFAHAKSKYSSRSIDNREKIDSSEAAIFTNRVAALLYLHLPLMVRQLTESMQVMITSLCLRDAFRNRD